MTKSQVRVDHTAASGARSAAYRDPYYLYLQMIAQLGEGRAFLLDAAAEETSKYQMSLVAAVPVLEVQVKDGVTSLFAVEGLDAYLISNLSASGIAREVSTEASLIPVGMESMKVSESVVSDHPIFYSGVDPMLVLERIRQAMRELYGETEFHDAPFAAGFLGYIGYDAVHYLEKLPKTTVDDRGLPDIRLQVHAVVVQLVHSDVSIYNGISGLSSVVSEQVQRRLEEQVSSVQRLFDAPSPLNQPKILAEARSAERGSFSAAFATDDVSQTDFEQNVSRAREYIAAGDIFQVVLSKRVRAQKQRHAYVIYDELRKLNPSPYMFIAEYPDMRVFGASPEVQFRSVGGVAEMKPIAGTSKGRGKTPSEDAALADALYRNEKERAEHVMLVDLCRNDLGRVCKIGTVHVKDLMHVEAYSHLFHLVSEVTGQLREDVSVFHALLATFPAGTLSGAPKIRAMEIIDELESLRRGPYGGMIGMIDFNANANTAIVIRTLVETGEAYYVQVGAGIVADSDPTQEWLECGHKAGAVLTVLGLQK
ncbi:chorismate-binding protein [Alicyclobacillus mengziensis]|uniref:Chorismate-binding protein n=1 Tax=Alicyclobacillus mengziensis TaxID=2931921 RepID=A0A9X7Z8A5_9BACL|nr:chorismate-binding protein [Alicyclobacillus mengziensis]QSO49427.1 chorismate-binding protein [Alicyclobacillus mengziensis]